MAARPFRAPALSSEGVYRVRFQLRITSGHTERFACVWQRGPERCATIEQPTATRSWASFDRIVRTEPGVTGLTLFLYAEATTDHPAEVQYRDVSITPLRTVGLATVDSATRPRVSRFLERGDHTLEVSRPSAALELRPDSPLGDCNRSDNRPVEKTGLDVRSIPRGVRLSARAHAACVTAVLPDAVAGKNYTLDLDVRTVSGARARLCVWQFGPNRCAEIDDLPADDNWTRYHTDVTLDPATQAARVYLYADGQDPRTTITEYRNLALRPVQPEVVELHPQDPQSLSPSPRITWRQHGSDSFDVHVHGPARGRLLVVDESFASGWQLDGAKASSHILANGYANAWALETTQPSTVTARFGPSRYMDIAIAVSILAAILAVAVALFLRRRSRHAPISRALVNLAEGSAPDSD